MLVLFSLLRHWFGISVYFLNWLTLIWIDPKPGLCMLVHICLCLSVCLSVFLRLWVHAFVNLRRMIRWHIASDTWRHLYRVESPWLTVVQIGAGLLSPTRMILILWVACVLPACLCAKSSSSVWHSPGLHWEHNYLPGFGRLTEWALGKGSCVCQLSYNTHAHTHKLLLQARSSRPGRIIHECARN